MAARSAPQGQHRPWIDGIRSGLSAATAPARHVWLAGLGGAALTVRAARHGWAQLVAEGATAEASLRRMLTRAPDREPETIAQS